ncbi:MAG: HDIG domain-containing protein [Prevotellaceae bacterium]|jgi:uncharacterized protein|nr:HDIG domain-containing protein [Prevotellaceae bacterium]
MLDTKKLLQKYYSENGEAYHILLTHSISVTQKALDIARRNPQENFDLQFVEEAAMLHDIGIFLTDAPRIFCFGKYPYICHNYLGGEILLKEGLPKHALVCERHTGTGISLAQIEQENLPLPQRNMMPISKEEQLICYADKFFSKTKLEKELSVIEIQKSLSKFGSEAVRRFDMWNEAWG